MSKKKKHLLMLVNKIAPPIDNYFIWIIYSQIIKRNHFNVTKKKIIPPIGNYLFESIWVRFNMYSFNSLCEKDFNILPNLMNLFLGGFIAA